MAMADIPQTEEQKAVHCPACGGRVRRPTPVDWTFKFGPLAIACLAVGALIGVLLTQPQGQPGGSALLGPVLSPDDEMVLTPPDTGLAQLPPQAAEPQLQGSKRPRPEPRASVEFVGQGARRPPPAAPPPGCRRVNRKRCRIRM